MDPLSLAVGAALLGAGWAAGLVTARRFQPSKYSSTSLEARCSCGHARSFHAPETNRCCQLVKGKATERDRWGFEVAWEQQVCACQRYDGPEPFGGFYVPEITDRTD